MNILLYPKIEIDLTPQERDTLQAMRTAKLAIEAGYTHVQMSNGQIEDLGQLVLDCQDILSPYGITI